MVGQNVPSLQQEMELHDEDGGSTFEEACLHVEQMTLASTDKPVVVDKGVGDVRIQELPLRALSNGTCLKYFVDVIADVANNAFKKGEIKTLAMRDAIANMYDKGCSGYQRATHSG